MDIKRNERTKRVFAASLVGVVLSVSLCAGSTVAWFQDTFSSKNTIEIGTFGVNASASLALTRSMTPLSSTATVLPAGFYAVRVGGVGNTPGYAWIGLKATRSDSPREVYATKLLTGGTAYTYEIMLNEETAVYVASVWDDVAPERPLEDGTMINYGRPPMPPPSEEEPAEDADTELTDSTDSTPPADSTDGTDSTSSIDSTSDTPSTGSTNSAPTIGSADSASSADATESTPAGSTSDTPSTGSTNGVPTTGSADSAPSADATESAPITGGDSTSAASGADSASEAGADPE